MKSWIIYISVVINTHWYLTAWKITKLNSTHYLVMKTANKRRKKQSTEKKWKAKYDINKKQQKYEHFLSSGKIDQNKYDTGEKIFLLGQRPANYVLSFTSLKTVWKTIKSKKSNVKPNWGYLQSLNTNQ